MAKRTVKPKKLKDHLTPDDRREAEACADLLDELISKHRRDGAVPIDALRFVRFRLERLARLSTEKPLGWESITPTP